ncbi:MAG: thioredoxin domain-containing protein [Patescibacteria group bacterium]
MESKEKEIKKDGVYLSNFVAMGISFFILVVAIAAGFFAKGYFSARPINTGTGTGTATGTRPTAVKAKSAKEIYDLLPKITDTDHVKGDKNAKIVLIEYSDFQCPFCARFHPTTKEFLSKYPDVAYVFRALPLDFHQFAVERAKAGECAVKLGGTDMFWTYADIVFGATDLNNVDLVQVGTQLGLNSAAFASCIKSTEFDKKINDTSDGGKQFLSAINEGGGYGTPGAVIINTSKKIAEKLAGAVPLSEVEAAYNKVK